MSFMTYPEPPLTEFIDALRDAATAAMMTLLSA